MTRPPNPQTIALLCLLVALGSAYEQDAYWLLWWLGNAWGALRYA